MKMVDWQRGEGNLFEEDGVAAMSEMSQRAKIVSMSSNLVELECSSCGKKYDAEVEQHLCTCGRPLLARYDLRHAAGTFMLQTLTERPRTLWRYAEVLPNDPPVSLGEGMTPLIHALRLGASMRFGQRRMERIFIK